VWLSPYFQQMKVIRHEAVSPDFYSGSWNPIVKAVPEMLPVLVIKEDVAPIGSPLSNMVRATRNCDTRNPWHGESMPDPTCLVKENMVVVPLFPSSPTPRPRASRREV
jgi:hypothetical protein